MKPGTPAPIIDTGTWVYMKEGDEEAAVIDPIDIDDSVMVIYEFFSALQMAGG